MTKKICKGVSFNRGALRKSLVRLIASLVFLGGASQALADPVDVTYTVSGSAGSWLLDFSVTNNLGGTQEVYFFGTQSSGIVFGLPTGWNGNGVNSSNSLLGGSATVYNNNWLNRPPTPGAVGAGQTLSGFQVQISDLVAPSNVAWFAYGIGSDYAGPGCFHCGSNPGFEGIAGSAVPLPAALPLFATGLGLMGWFALT